MKIKIPIGYTNISYKKDNTFFQEKIKNEFNHKTNYQQLDKFDFVPKLYEDNDQYSSWEWIEGNSLDNPTEEDLKELSIILKTLHNSNAKFTKSNVRRRITVYRNILKDKNIHIPIIDKLYKKINNILKVIDTTKPIHGDLYRTNILKRKSDGKLFIIDWEYSHMGDIHYELAYIIEAYEFNEDLEKFFLDLYQDYDLKLLNYHKILVNYITILWLYSQDTLPFPAEKLIKRLETKYEKWID